MSTQLLSFIPLIFLSSEHTVILAKYTLLYSYHYWSFMTLSGFLGFAIGIVTVMQINCTSPLTHNISGTAKACVQTMLAFLIWQTPTTLNSILGNILVIGGSLAYAWVRMIEMSNNGSVVVPVPSSSMKKVN